MAAANASPPSSPAPDGCAHPSPVVGIMAHEFAHYPNAQGPEGTRRTVTYYGPVMGGMPIQAWHCPSCGVLRLTHPDGRKEERLLFPGRQAGLISEPSVVSADQRYFGMQARVSGLSSSPDMLRLLVPADGPGGSRRTLQQVLDLPDLGAATWTVVVLLAGVVAALMVAGIAATYDWTTPGFEGQLVAGIAAAFGLAAVILLAGSVWRHYGPAVPLTPPLVIRERGAAHLDGATYCVVVLLGLSVAGLFAAGILATYDWTTAAAEAPVLIGTIGSSVLAAVILIVSGIASHLRRH